MMDLNVCPPGDPDGGQHQWAPIGLRRPVMSDDDRLYGLPGDEYMERDLRDIAVLVVAHRIGLVLEGTDLIVQVARMAVDAIGKEFALTRLTAGDLSMSVHDQPDFARVYDEDEIISIRKGDLRALLDVASTSMDFGSGFMNDEEVEILRSVAVTLGVDPMEVTPSNHQCKYGPHAWRWTRVWQTTPPKGYEPRWVCTHCSLEDLERPAPEDRRNREPLRP